MWLGHALSSLFDSPQLGTLLGPVKTSSGDEIILPLLTLFFTTITFEWCPHRRSYSCPCPPVSLWETTLPECRAPVSRLVPGFSRKKRGLWSELESKGSDGYEHNAGEDLAAGPLERRPSWPRDAVDSASELEADAKGGHRLPLSSAGKASITSQKASVFHWLFFSSSMLIPFGVSGHSSDTENRFTQVNCWSCWLFCECSFSFHPSTHFHGYFGGDCKSCVRGCRGAII